MNREDDQQLWDILARNVVRQIRQEPRWFERARSWLRLRRLVPASGLALVAIAAIIFVHNPLLRQKPVATEPDPVAKIDVQDYEVVADLDELLASDENNLWDEDSTL
jgi:uncharacterized membrane protein